MKKKVLCMSLAVILLSQTGVMAAQEHKHVWIDDIKNSDETTNRYYCECGEVRDEIIADIRNFIVSFDANGGYVETETVETYKNRIKRLPIPENTSDYQWDGWYTEPDGGEIVTENWVYDSDTTLYAHWTVTGTYTLKFASDGGSYIRPITALYGETLDLTEYVPEKTGYIFKGWYIGFPYVWGGSSPSTSFDCSGFVCWSYTHSGVYNLPRTTAQGIYDQCAKVSRAEARPGDLVFFTRTYVTNEAVTHIGIFVGDGLMLHCGNPIQYASIDSDYWSSHMYGFGRLIQ